MLNKILSPFIRGNSFKYRLKRVKTLKQSPLKQKRLIFLGSSVTQGAFGFGLSFVDYLQKRHSLKVIKEAVSGTTLVEQGEDSYIERMVSSIDRSFKADYFICQLSTNDASQQLPLGEISPSSDLNSMDTATITGALEYIILYALKIWKCPVIFYTGSYYECREYDFMVERLKELQTKYSFYIINLWENKTMQNRFQAHYMVDDIHPTRAGYLEWWTPVIEEFLLNLTRI